MPIFYVRRSGSEELQPEENVLVWFGKAAIRDCEHALVLYGGDLVFLKTVETVDRERLLELAADYQKWREVFGVGHASSELRAAVIKSQEVNK